MQDQTNNTDNKDQNYSEFESTKIIHIGTKGDCSILIKTGERNYKTLWDSGAGKCVISYDKYKTIPEKRKTQLFPSKILIKAENGSMIENKGECDITFKIGPVRFTFTFLVSNELTQELTTTISTKAINALVQCAESIIIPPRSNAVVKCRVPKVLCHQSYERICVFEPSNRHTSDNAACHTYNGTVVMDDDVKRSGILEIAMTNTSWKAVKIRRNTNMGLLKSCVQDEICTIHQILTLTNQKKPKSKVAEKNMYAVPIRTKSGQIEINTLIPIQAQPRIGIHEIGPQEDFEKYEKPKLTDAPVNTKVLEDLEKLLEENKMLLHKMKHKLGQLL